MASATEKRLWSVLQVLGKSVLLIICTLNLTETRAKAIFAFITVAPIVCMSQDPQYCPQSKMVTESIVPGSNSPRTVKVTWCNHGMLVEKMASVSSSGVTSRAVSSSPLRAANIYAQAGEHPTSVSSHLWSLWRSTSSTVLPDSSLTFLLFWSGPPSSSPIQIMWPAF